MVWQPYEAKLEDLPPWCVARRAVLMAMVSHTLDRVVRQFGMIQEIPCDVDTDEVFHKIDLRGKVGVNWMRKHAEHILNWGNHLERHFKVLLGDMPPQHGYFGWFNRVTRRFIDRPGAKLTMIVSSLSLVLHHTILLSMKPLSS